MATRKRGLGRGLDALLGGKPAAEKSEVRISVSHTPVSADAGRAAAAAVETLPTGERLVRLAVGALRPGRAAAKWTQNALRSWLRRFGPMV